MNAVRSPVHLAEHDVERAQHGGHVRQHVPAAQVVHGLEMREARGADLAAVRLVGAVGDEIDAELALRSLDGGINLALGHMEALGVELEVMDERFHRPLHVTALGRDDLAVRGIDRALPFRGAKLLEALLHDARGLPHLLHADAVAVVAVAVLADRDVELEFLVALVGLRLAQIPRRARPAHHDPREPPRPRLVERDDSDVNVALLEDPVVRQQAFEVVADLQERIAEVPYLVDELRREILVDAARPHIGRMHARARGPAHRRSSASRAPRNPTMAG